MGAAKLRTTLARIRHYVLVSAAFVEALNSQALGAWLHCTVGSP
jgi:hypothetical protein